MANRFKRDVPSPDNAQAGEKIGVIGANQGARVTTRANAGEAADRARANAEKRFEARHGKGVAHAASRRLGNGSSSRRASAQGPERSGKNIVLLVAASIVALLALFGVGSCVAGLLAPAPEAPEVQKADQGGPQQLPAAGPSEDDSPARTVSAEGGPLTYGGVQYDIHYEVESGDAVVTRYVNGHWEEVFALEGSPAALVLFDGTLVVPQTLADGTWSVVCYVPAAGAEPSSLVGPDGKPATGSSRIQSVSLEGDDLVIVDESGATSIPLV